MPCATCTTEARCDRAGLCQTFARKQLDGLEVCPTCDGGGRVVDLRFGRPRRLNCRTCKGSGKIDAGVWPYEPLPSGAGVA
jgi:DnaJ-class molecular chaperone